MPVNWEKVKRALYPMKDYEDLCKRLQVSFSYPFVRETFNPAMPELVEYTRSGVGGDPRHRYDDYAAMLVDTFTELHQAGVKDLLELSAAVETREKLAAFAEQSGVEAHNVAAALKYLVYWFIPTEKYLGGLVRNDPAISAAIKRLRELGIRTNLDLLQRGITASGRKTLADESGLPEAVISELVNRADLSRMPWASKATISNIMGAGYGSLARLANADPERLSEDFFRHGKAIGKNLKYGNEIENSYRIAKIVPTLLEQ
jgi:hypothetical protein